MSTTPGDNNQRAQSVCCMRFHGGPYDGHDLPIQPSHAKFIRLPVEQELASFLGTVEEDPGATGSLAWPHLYELDDTAELAVYRFQSD